MFQKKSETKKIAKNFIKELNPIKTSLTNIKSSSITKLLEKPLLFIENIEKNTCSICPDFLNHKFQIQILHRSKFQTPTNLNSKKNWFFFLRDSGFENSNSENLETLKKISTPKNSRTFCCWVFLKFHGIFCGKIFSSFELAVWWKCMQKKFWALKGNFLEFFLWIFFYF